MHKHSSYSAYYKNIAMLATNGSYYMPNTDLGTGRSSTLYYKPKYYTNQRIRVNYKVRPMHLPGLEEDDGSSSGGYSSATERTIYNTIDDIDSAGEEDNDNDLLNISDLSEADIVKGITFVENDKDIACRGGGYEPDGNGRSPIYSEWTQDDNKTFNTDGDSQTEKPESTDIANIKEVKMKNTQNLKEFQKRYGLSFNQKEHMHNDRLLLIKRIENAVLTAQTRKRSSLEKIRAVMHLMLKGTLNNIASQPVLKERLLKFEQNNGLSNAPIKRSTSQPDQGSSKSFSLNLASDPPDEPFEANQPVETEKGTSESLNFEKVMTESELKGVFKKISIKYDLNRAFDETYMNQAYIQKLIKMSKLVDILGKRNNLDKIAIGKEMFKRITQRKNGHLVGMSVLQFNINRLYNELESSEKRMHQINTPNTA